MIVDNCQVNEYIKTYVKKLAEIKEPVKREVDQLDSYRLIKYIKRTPVGVGPYPAVSLFESCNRIFSDLVVLIGVKCLLEDLSAQFPFKEYNVALGTEHGIDVKAHNLSQNVSLVGEAFSVAKTFFNEKKRITLKGILKNEATYKVVIFNSDAVSNPSQWDLRFDQGVTYITIDVEDYIKELGND